MRLCTKRDRFWARYAAFLAIFFATTAHAQTDLSRWPTVKLQLFFADKKGDPLPIPSTGSLLLTEDGHPQTIAEISAATGPRAVCILIDTSGSMYDRVDSATAAAIRFIQGLPREDDVCIASFAWNMRMLRPLTSDHALASTALNRSLVATGGTALFDSVIALASYLQTSRKPDTVLLIFTDGSDNASKGDRNALAQTITALETAHAPVVHIIRIPNAPSAHAPAQQAHDQQTILALTSVGAGLPYFPRSERELQANIDDMLERMRSRLVVTYTTSDPDRGGRERRLDWKLSKSSGGPKGIIRAPEGYYAPSE